MVLKLGDLQGVVESLDNILEQRLPIKAAYWFGKFVEKARRELQHFNANRIRLLEQYCRKHEDGTPVRLRGEGEERVEVEKDYQGQFHYDIDNIPPADKEAFGKEYEDLATTEVSFDFRPLKLEDLGSKAELTPLEMVPLLPFLEEPENPPAAPVQ